MSRPEQNLDRKFTYKDYLTWSEEEQWELINGIPYIYNFLYVIIKVG